MMTMDAKSYYLLAFDSHTTPEQGVIALNKAIKLCKKNDMSVDLGDCYWGLYKLNSSSYNSSNNQYAAHSAIASGKHAVRLCKDKNTKAQRSLELGKFSIWFDDAGAVKAFTQATEDFTENKDKALAYFEWAYMYHIRQLLVLYRSFLRTCFNYKGNLLLAIQHYNSAVSLAGQNNSALPYYQFYLGLAYADWGDHEKAVIQYTSAIDGFQNQPSERVNILKLYFNRVLSYLALNKFELAVQGCTHIPSSAPINCSLLGKEELRKFVTYCPDFYESVLKNKLNVDHLRYIEQFKTRLENQKSFSKEQLKLFKPKKDSDCDLAYQSLEGLEMPLISKDVAP
jgi:tetratricopeptide (TPR) repeat protein